MSTPPSKWFPGLIHWHKHCGNGFYPDTALHTKLTTAENHLTAYRHKELFRRSMLPTARVGASGTTNLWRFRCRTGYGTKALWCALVSGRPSSTGTDPYTRIAVTKVGGATANVDLHTSVGNVTPTDAPSEWVPQNGLTPVDPASAYEVLVSAVDYARPLSLCVYELGTGIFDETTDWYNDIDVAAGGAIRDGDQRRWGEGLMRMLRQNGATQLNWCLYNGAARTRSSATLINLINNSSTGTPTATTPGWRVDMTYRNTVSRTGVPFEFAVYASMAAGTGSVYWKDTSGNTVASVNINSATPQWWTTTGTVAGALKFDPLYGGDGINTLSVYAASAYEWEDA